jgi:hypothetical protein
MLSGSGGDATTLKVRRGTTTTNHRMPRLPRQQNEAMTAIRSKISYRPMPDSSHMTHLPESW